MAREVPGFVIRGAPRTKKNSQRVVNIGPMCRVCGKRGGFPKVLPSEAYEEWERSALLQIAGFRSWLGPLPVTDPVSICAMIYRDRDTGDTQGFYDAIADMLQKAEILKDDKLIEDWDGSRRLKDAANPRVEIYITILEERPVQGDLI